MGMGLVGWLGDWAKCKMFNFLKVLTGNSIPWKVLAKINYELNFSVGDEFAKRTLHISTDGA